MLIPRFDTPAMPRFFLPVERDTDPSGRFLFPQDFQALAGENPIRGGVLLTHYRARSPRLVCLLSGNKKSRYSVEHRRFIKNLLFLIRFGRDSPPALFFEIPRRLGRFGRGGKDRPRIVLEELEPRADIFGVPEPAGNRERRREKRRSEFRHQFLCRIGRFPKPAREVAVESAFMSGPVGMLVEAGAVIVGRTLEGFRRREADTIERRHVTGSVAAVPYMGSPHRTEKTVRLFHINRLKTMC